MRSCASACSQDGQVLEYSRARAAGRRTGSDPAKLPGIVVDDAQAKLDRRLEAKAARRSTCVGDGYRHDDNARDGQGTARFEAKLPQPGRYEVRLAYPPNSNRATQRRRSKSSTRAANKALSSTSSKRPPIDGLFVSLGDFDFAADKPAAVVVCNRGADGHVIIDAVQWIGAAK